jgi:hypothetical protein
LSSRNRGASIICKALLKYGYVGFRLEILEYCPSSIVQAREQFYIDKLNPEYNILKIAGSFLGYKHNEASLKFKREVMLGRKLSKDQLEKMAENNPYRVPLVLSNTVTGKREEFSSMAKVALFLGVHVTTVKRYLINNKPYNGYMITKATYSLDISSSSSLTNKSQAILLTHSVLGITKQFPTMKAACEFLDISHRRLFNYLKNNEYTDGQEVIKEYIDIFILYFKKGLSCERFNKFIYLIFIFPVFPFSFSLNNVSSLRTHNLFYQSKGKFSNYGLTAVTRRAFSNASSNDGFSTTVTRRAFSNTLIKDDSYTNSSEVFSNLDIILNPNWVTGFMDAESCFSISIVINPDLKMGWTVKAIFILGLHKKDRMILELLQKFFGVGNIKPQGKDSVQYRVTSIKDLMGVIIPHFEKFPLITQKRADFILFKQVVNLMNNKEHLTIEGFKKIINIKASINKGVPTSLKSAFPSIVPVKRPNVENIVISDPYWIAGFTSGDGCFTINMTKYIQLVFLISQHSRDKELMENLISYLGCGTLRSSANKDFVEIRVTKLEDLTGIIIPFFKKYPIIGVKALDFADWCKAVEIVKDKSHRNIEGLKEISQIKAGINKGRNKSD